MLEVQKAFTHRQNGSPATAQRHASRTLLSLHLAFVNTPTTGASTCSPTCSPGTFSGIYCFQHLEGSIHYHEVSGAVSCTSFALIPVLPCPSALKQTYHLPDSMEVHSRSFFPAACIQCTFCYHLSHIIERICSVVLYRSVCSVAVLIGSCWNWMPCLDFASRLMFDSHPDHGVTRAAISGDRIY